MSFGGYSTGTGIRRRDPKYMTRERWGVLLGKDRGVVEEVGLRRNSVMNSDCLHE